MKPALGVMRLRILVEAVMRQPGVTISALVRMFGIRRNAIHGHLLVLRKQGLVDWEDRQHCTLRATCRWIPAEAMG